jgi:hypothetical protein
MPKFNFFLLFLLLLFGLIFLSCKEYLGYQFEGDLTKQNVKISGTITNKFTGDSLDEAFVKFGDVTALSDKKGHFSLVYELGQDEERDKPVPVTISKSKYLPFQKEIILFPPKLDFNIRLSYGAPILKASAFFPYRFSGLEDKWVLQVRIFDYQGWQDIREVKATVFYISLHNGDQKSVESEMLFVKAPDDTSAYFQSVFDQYLYLHLEKEWQIQQGYEILAIDSTNLHDFKQGMAGVIVPDNPLFDPTEN